MHRLGRAYLFVSMRRVLLGSIAASLMLACPRKKDPPPPVVADAAQARASEEDASVSDAAVTALPPLDAWVPEHASITLTADWRDRYNDGPKLEYTTLGLPALSADAQHVVVHGREDDRTPDPSLRVITLSVAEDRQESSSTIQALREYREALYPSSVDEPTPALIDAEFRKLIKEVDKRIASTNASLASYAPIPPCRLEPQDDAGVRLAATCAGLFVTYEQHHLRVVGRGGRVRLDRSVAAWKTPPTTPLPNVEYTQRVEAIYGDAERAIVVFKFQIAALRYYGATPSVWHVVKLGP